MKSSRIVFAIIISLSLHVGAVGAYFYMDQVSRREAPRIISNVDLMVQVHKTAVSVSKPVVKTPPSTWNFLKLALPELPQARPQAMDVKIPEMRHALMDAAPKLEDRGHRMNRNQLQALDLNHRRADMAQVSENLNLRHQSAALADMPKLEEVGVRQVKNLPQALELDERRREAQTLQTLGQVQEPTERHGAPAMQALQEEAAPSGSSGLSQKLANLLPSADERLDMGPQGAAPPPQDLDALKAQPIEHKQTQALPEAKKKGVEIEGPLANRKVISYEIPVFPDWARDQGILEASVAIKFWVTSDGSVEPGVRVERTSGYGQLDRLAMDSLKKWVFVPLTTDERQWGVITFRFLLE